MQYFFKDQKHFYFVWRLPVILTWYTFIKNDTMNKNNKLNINSDVICQFIYLYKLTRAVVRTVNCVWQCSLTWKHDVLLLIIGSVVYIFKQAYPWITIQRGPVLRMRVAQLISLTWSGKPP